MAALIRQETSELEAERLKAVKSGDWRPYIAMLEAFGKPKEQAQKVKVAEVRERDLK